MISNVRPALPGSLGHRALRERPTPP